MGMKNIKNMGMGMNEEAAQIGVARFQVWKSPDGNCGCQNIYVATPDHLRMIGWTMATADGAAVFYTAMTDKEVQEKLSLCDKRLKEKNSPYCNDCPRQCCKSLINKLNILKKKIKKANNENVLAKHNKNLKSLKKQIAQCKIQHKPEPPAPLPSPSSSSSLASSSLSSFGSLGVR